VRMLVRESVDLDIAVREYYVAAMAIVLLRSPRGSSVVLSSKLALPVRPYATVLRYVV
jgi:hypothetical protein